MAQSANTTIQCQTQNGLSCVVDKCLYLSF